MSMDEPDEAPADELRAWARGMLPLEAATELLIRGGFAQTWRPWVRWDADANRHWIAFASIPDEIGGMSGGQGRFLRIAASIGGDVPVILGDEIPGLDRTYLTLVLSAVSHACGAHETGRTIDFVDGQPKIVPLPPLNAWASETRS